MSHFQVLSRVTQKRKVSPNQFELRPSPNQVCAQNPHMLIQQNTFVGAKMYMLSITSHLAYAFAHFYVGLFHNKIDCIGLLLFIDSNPLTEEVGS